MIGINDLTQGEKYVKKDTQGNWLPIIKSIHAHAIHVRLLMLYAGTLHVHVHVNTMYAGLLHKQIHACVCTCPG